MDAPIAPGVFRWSIHRLRVAQAKEGHSSMEGMDNAPFQKSLISKGSTRWKSFATGALTQIALTGMVAVLPLALPNRLRPILRAHAVVDLSMPKMTIDKAQPFHEGKSTRNQKRVNRESHLSLNGIRNAVLSPVISSPVLATAKSVRPAATPTLVFTGTAPELPLRISAIPNLQPPRAQIQTGDFADLNAASDRGHGAGPISSVARGGDMPSMASPVVILFKPQPRYTFDALTNKVQGDVLLAVIFSASGSVKVLSIIHRLGYGLDESAETAAGQIRFRPARDRKGIPVDITAIIRVTFDLTDCGAGCLTSSTTESFPHS